MPYAFVLYPTPVDATVTLTPDSGGSYTGVPYTDPATSRQGQVCYIAEGTPDQQGTTLNVSAPNYLPERLRGFLVLDAADDEARLQVDDVVLELAALAPEPTPPPSGPPNPLDIINRVYADTQPQLWTLDGCGTFTEDCCDALHVESSAYWGHIKKDPGQNQFNGHAVDAVHLALNVPGCNAGIYDIIYSSVSAEAKPVFNLAGPPEYDKWYYPASDASKATPVFFVRVR